MKQKDYFKSQGWLFDWLQIISPVTASARITFQFTEEHSETCRTSKMELFSAKSSILDVPLGSEYTSELNCLVKLEWKKNKPHKNGNYLDGIYRKFRVHKLRIIRKDYFWQ